MLTKLTELRSASRATRIRWVIILSTISTIIVVLVWVATFNMITAQITTGTLVKPAATDVASIGSRIKSIFGELKLRTGNTVEYFRNNVASKEIEIKQQAQASTTN